MTHAPILSPPGRTAAPHPETTAFALSALAAIFWGTNFEATRIVLQDLPPWTAAAGRFGIAAGDEALAHQVACAPLVQEGGA